MTDDNEFWFHNTYQDRSSAVAQAKHLYRAIRFNQNFKAGNCSILKSSKTDCTSNKRKNETKSEGFEFAINSDGSIIDPNGWVSYFGMSSDSKVYPLDRFKKSDRVPESGRFKNQCEVSKFVLKNSRNL